jgi:two-component system repressor protein LuxO
MPRALEALSRILIVEDDPTLARIYREYLKAEPWEVGMAETGRAALAAIAARMPEALVLDLGLPDMDGLDILRKITNEALPIAVVVVTSQGSISVAVEAMKAGARDFLVKPFPAERLVVTLGNALDHQRLQRIVQTYREDFDRRAYFGFIGSSLAMQAVYRSIDSAGPSKATVFISGESGVGKEVCAEAIHKRSPRRDKPFVAINCAAIPRDLMESEIFGHVKGAFTGAVAEHEGAARRADQGTLFLDEICEMDLGLQSKLLRFVQTGSFVKVGGGVTEKVDVRFICATNRDPLGEVGAGRFREDLYYRLHVIPIELPPLREREDDVMEIARHFLATYAREEGKAFRDFAPEAESVFRAYDWPGNVRQLQNVIRSTVVLNDGELVTSAMLPALVAGRARPRPSRPEQPAPPPPVNVDRLPVVKPMWQVEKEAIEEALRITGGNVPRAAVLLEMSPSTVYRKKSLWDAQDQEEAS